MSETGKGAAYDPVEDYQALGLSDEEYEMILRVLGRGRQALQVDAR